MDPNGICESFLVADKIINGDYDVYTTLDELSKKSEFYEHCPNRKCVTDIQKIGALSTYLFVGMKAHQNSEDAEYFLMWLSDKLFKMHIEGKKKRQIKKITLDEAYKRYLEKHMGNYRYWNLLNHVTGLKNANLRHMNEFYKLLNHICKTIIYLKYNYNKSTNHIQNSTNSFNQYMLLYQNVSGCESYLHLLDNLKKTYDKFRNFVITNGNDPNLAIYLQTLTTIENTDSYFVQGFKKFDFSDSKCKLRYDEKILTKYMEAKAQEKQKDSGANGDKNKQSSQPQSSVDQTPSPSARTGTSSNVPDNGGDTTGSKDKVADGTQSQENTKESEKTDTDGDTGSKSNLQIDSSSHTQTSDSNQGGESGGGLVDSQDDKVGSGDGSVDKPNDSQVNQGGSGGTDGVICDKVGTGSGKGDTDNGEGNSNGVTGGINGGKGDKDTNKGDTSSGACGGQGTPNPVSINPSSAPENSDDGSKASGDQDSTNSSGTSDGYWSSTLGNRLNLLNYLPSASKIYETQNRILTDASNKINNAYNSAMTAVKDTYDSVLTNINYAYTTSTDYISGAVNSMTSQLNPFGMFTSGDNQSGSGSSGNGSSTGDSPLKILKTPKLDPDSPPLPPPIPSPSPSLSLPQSQSPSVTLPPLQKSPSLPSQLQQVTPQSIQATNLQPQSGPSQDSSQITDQNSGSDPVQIHDTNPGTRIPQTTNSITGPSSTWNGSITGTVVKMIEKSSIWCIASNKKCDILSIGIISISIFAFLTIMYKYLSFGSSKKSEKKNMKRVINFHDGNRKTKIIISSNDKKKDLKPVINSVGRKKDPTLNIYKLMQADPVPFINLFFLLMFFVYKKKLYYLEL
ncbi:CIR protein PIR protein [Plasmodium vinckei lentum]|uniref:CIR protein PIR protein n=1 Tax=Plasmodium vinckei lentum TaxID=138297 RepID=A0A6V7S441_PLAVN|nr:CIR protein PIR protein [Plasmodium vinckei lentum]